MRFQRGLTLIELVVVISLLGVVALSFAFLFSSSQRFLAQSMNATSAQGEASYALEHIRRFLFLATDIAVPAEGANGAALQFTWQPTAVGGAVATVTSDYRLNGTRLEFRRTAGDPYELIAQGIDAINFNRTARASVEVTLTARRTSAQDTRRTQLRTTVNPRGI